MQTLPSGALCDHGEAKQRCRANCEYATSLTHSRFAASSHGCEDDGVKSDARLTPSSCGSDRLLLLLSLLSLLLSLLSLPPPSPPSATPPLPPLVQCGTPSGSTPASSTTVGKRSTSSTSAREWRGV